MTGVAPEDAIAYLSNGVRLTNENLRELAGSNDNVHDRSLLQTRIANWFTENIRIRQILP